MLTSWQDKLIDSAKKKLAQNGQIMYTGYGQFFGQESNQCDGVTWVRTSPKLKHLHKANTYQAYWYEYGKREYLKQDKRKKMNELVLNMNKALSEAVGRAGDSVTFVDYDKYYVDGEGRFCEDDFKETSPNRYGLLFYEWNTDDSADETDGLTATDVGSAGSFEPSLVMNGTFEAAINDWARKTLEKNPDWAKGVANAQGAALSIDSVQATDEQKAIGYSSSIVPDSYGRVFHPRPNGHALIANLVLYHVSANYAKRINQDWPQEEVAEGTCSAGTSTIPDGPAPEPSCDTHALSGIPYNVFSGSSAGSTDVYGKFCDAVEKDQKKELTWTTDASGNEKSKKLRMMKRTPPPNPKAYDSYSFKLNFKPSSDASSGCRSSCADAFSTISNSPCGHQGGTQNGMTAKASLDVSCGTYSYEITGEDVPAVQGPPSPSLSAQYCFPSDAFGEHGDISPDWQAQYTGWACAGSAKKTIKKGDPSTFVHWNTTTNGVPYTYSVTWEDDCESSETEMNVYQPLPDNEDANCMDLLQNNYKDCKSAKSFFILFSFFLFLPSYPGGLFANVTFHRLQRRRRRQHQRRLRQVRVQGEL